MVSNGSLFSSEGHNNTNNYNQNGGQIASMSATALLQKAAQMGSKRSSSSSNNSTAFGLMTSSIFNNKQMENIKTKDVDEGGFTRDFLGVGSQHRPWPLLMVNRNLPDPSPPATTDGTPTANRNQ